MGPSSGFSMPAARKWLDWEQMRDDISLCAVLKTSQYNFSPLGIASMLFFATSVCMESGGYARISMVMAFCLLLLSQSCTSPSLPAVATMSPPGSFPRSKHVTLSFTPRITPLELRLSGSKKWSESSDEMTASWSVFW